MSTVDSGHYETSYGGQGGSEETVLAHPSVRPLLSDAHFCVDGTLIKAWASMKSFQPKEDTAPPRHHDHGAPPPPAKDQPFANTDTPPRQTETQSMHDTHRQPRNAEVNFRGGEALERHPCLGHGPGCPPLQKGTGRGGGALLHGAYTNGEPQWSHSAGRVGHANGFGARKAALEMINRHSPGSTRRLTLGADKGYDSANVVAKHRRMVVTPHVAQETRHTAIDKPSGLIPTFGTLDFWQR